MAIHARLILFTFILSGCASTDAHTIDRAIGGGCVLERVVETETDGARRVEVDCY